MPKTKFQDVIFTLLMVVVMVYALVVYNISLDRGGLTNEVFVMAFGELVIMGIAAFLLEMFLAGPLAKKLAFSIADPGKDRQIVVILVVSAMTVCIMCPLMSLIATLLFKGVDSQVVAKWLQTTVLNFPMAFCWQIFFAGPFVRWIFRHLFKDKEACAGEAAAGARSTGLPLWHYMNGLVCGIWGVRFSSSFTNPQRVLKIWAFAVPRGRLRAPLASRMTRIQVR